MLRKVALVLAAVTGFALVAPVVAGAVPAACAPVDWGSADKVVSPTTSGYVADVRAGRQECFDRLVFDFAGANDGFWVGYVPEVAHEGSGDPVPLRGAGKLHVMVHSPAYDGDGNPTYVFADAAELVDVTGFQTFRQVAWAGSFEGVTSVGLGVRARLPFRVFTLSGRVVVDVAHVW
ncbi:MAG: hypothetical protein HOV94_42970 [Saccharothrix sp.]|nr:hypothetical protein [Saccharothrix sp.]